ncbi:hypothetical protein HPP92_024136 [Vanilla planifolia]|uniref:Uncharacterized protein n=1 Tax=Vanilla planifolia TaxID=51239 RepID=A0A835PS73_VANPL|nr:hypothetical protein HPP92_024410 [Vanilla planifolia]KAG0456348.1 hypothetical protein HPP92_024136 [Vanilla planifolia]
MALESPAFKKLKCSVDALRLERLQRSAFPAFEAINRWDVDPLWLEKVFSGAGIAEDGAYYSYVRGSRTGLDFMGGFLESRNEM